MTSLQPLISYIRRIIPLNEEAESIVHSRFHIRRYLKNQFVVQAGDVCDHESFVLSGCLKTFYLDPNGHEHIVMFAIEDWWTADLGSFISQSPADYNVQCLEHSTLAQISYEDLEMLFKEVPQFERFFRIIISRAFVSAQKRLMDNFSLTAKERYLQFRKRYPRIEQRVPQYMIASYLGFTPEFLSKIRNQLIFEDS